MEKYEVTLSISVDADSAIDAFDQVKEMIGDTGEISLSPEVNTQLFNELGVSND